MAEEKRSLNARFTKYYNQTDWLLLFIMLLITALGLTMMYSIGGKALLLSRVGFVIVGVALILIPTFFDVINFENLKSRIKKTKYTGVKDIIVKDLVSPPGLFLIFATILQALCYVPGIGVEHNGSKRWIRIGVELQPVEVVKIAVILFVAYMIYHKAKKLDSLFGIITTLWYIVPALGLIAIENTSSALIVGVIAYLMCFVITKNKKLWIVLAIIVVAAGALLIVWEGGYRAGRIKSYFETMNYDGLDDTVEKTQPIKGLLSIANGGLTGTGIGMGVQKNTLPEKTNDMIFAVICEEMGLIGGMVLVLLYIMLLWRIIIIANAAPSMFASFYCYGVMFQFGLQVVLNIAVVTNFIPNTGVALPFISSGGTATLLQMIEIAFVIIISKTVKHKY